MHPVWHSSSSAIHPHDQSHSGDRASQCLGRRPPSAAENQRTKQPLVSEQRSVQVRRVVVVEPGARFSPVGVAEPSA
eukprot:3288632-Pleurochrysis_carterae.AAC.1